MQRPRGGATLSRSAGIASLLALALLVASIRPLTQSDGHAGVRRGTLHSQTARDDAPDVGAPAILDARPIDLPLTASIPRLIEARTDSHPMVMRPHLKLPPSRSDDPLPAL